MKRIMVFEDTPEDEERFNLYHSAPKMLTVINEMQQYLRTLYKHTPEDMQKHLPAIKQIWEHFIELCNEEGV